MKKSLFYTNIKVFVRNLLYVFVPMGIIYLSLICIILVYGQFALEKTTAAINDISTTLNQTLNYDRDILLEYIKTAVKQINFSNDPLSVYKEIVSTSWIQNTLTGFINIISFSTTTAPEVEKIINSYAHSLIVGINNSIIIFAVMIYVSAFITRIVLRRFNARRSIFKSILSYVINSTLIALIISLATYLISLWKFSAIFSGLFYILVLSFSSLLLAFFIYGYRKVPIKKIINYKNILEQIGADFVILIVSMVAIILIAVFLSPILAFLLTVPLLVYIASIITIQSESYVFTMVSRELPTRQIIASGKEKVISGETVKELIKTDIETKDTEKKENKPKASKKDKNDSKPSSGI